MTAVVSQEYEIDVNKEYVIRGNSAILKCQFPSFMADHLLVESWTIDDSQIVTQSESYGTVTLHLLHLLPLTDPDPYPSLPTLKQVVT